VKNKKTIRTLLICSFLLAIIGCEKTDPVNNDGLKLETSNHLGCFIDNPKDVKNACSYGSDTVYATAEADQLVLHVVKNYNCCGLLNDSISVDGNNAEIFIEDTCMQDCLCYCLCGFVFEYRFQVTETQHQFTIYLKAIEEEGYELWKTVVWEPE